MKISIIGAGTMGSALARELATFDDVREIVICDAHTRSLQHLAREVDSPRLSPFQIDARDIRTLAPIVEGSGCILGASSPSLNPDLADLSIETGSHFCDLGGGNELIQNLSSLGDRARARGVWVVPNCGLDPGLTNVLCLLGVHHFDTAQHAWIRVGDVPLDPEPPFNFRISWSADKLIHDYTAPVVRVENGKLTTVAPLQDLETLSFPTPFNRMEAFSTAGDAGPVWNATSQTLDSLDRKSIRWPGHADQMRFILGLGFAEERIIDVRTHLTYRDVLVRRLKQRLGGGHEDAVLLRVGVSGLIDGVQRTLIYEMDYRFDRKNGISAVQKCTSVPAALIARRLARGDMANGGATPPESLFSDDGFLEEVRSRGLEIEERWDAAGS